jgi:hypothetical protein
MAKQQNFKDKYVTTPEGEWWPPGRGEPGKDWDGEDAELRLIFDDPLKIDVVMIIPEGERALVSVPIYAIAEILARGRHDRQTPMYGPSESRPLAKLRARLKRPAAGA